MKIYTKIFISLSILFILSILYNTIQILKKNNYTNVIERYSESFYEKFKILESKLDSMERIHWNFPFPTYYINLDSDIYKNKFIQDQIDYYNCKNITRILGVDARQNVPTHLNIGEFNYPIESNLKLSNSEMGCLLSHLKVIISAYYVGYEHIIILEDDAYFKHARIWKTSIENIVTNAPKDWNVLNLYNSTICCGTNFQKSDYIKHSPEVQCYLSSSYIINRKGMYNVLKQINLLQYKIIQLFTDDTNKYHGADELIFKWAGNTYFVNPSTFFIYNDSDKMKTSIQNDADLQNQLINALYVLDQYI